MTLTTVKLNDILHRYMNFGSTVTDHTRADCKQGCLLKDLKYEVSNLRSDETWRTSLARTTSLSRFQIQQLAVERISEPHSSPVPLLGVYLNWGLLSHALPSHASHPTQSCITH